MGFDKGIDYISYSNALRWVLIRKLIIFPFVMPCAMGFDKGIDYISHRNTLRWVLIRVVIILLIVMPCDGFDKGKLILFLIVMPCAMGFDKGNDYISLCNALCDGL